MAALMLVFAGIAASCPAGEPPPRRNVLLIVADDLGPRLGCYGDMRARTPHIDRLAFGGVRFDRAYAQYPVCNPSRVSFLTGLRPDTTGIMDNVTPVRANLPDVVTLPQHFRSHGYFTASIAKVFHVGQGDPRIATEKPGTWKLDDPASWDFRLNTFPTGRGLQGDSLDLAGAPVPGDTLNFRTKADGNDDDQADGQAVRDALALFADQREKPFFIAVGFRRPHAAWIAPRRYFDLYPLSSLRLPEPADRAAVPAAAFTNQESNYGNPDGMRQMLQAYYATTSFLDEQVGRLLRGLDEHGLRHNTLVVLLGDHGFHLGEHGLWHTGTLFEEGVRTPLIIAAPGVAGNGESCGAPVELVDLYPTLVELAGLPARHGLEGVSLAPLLEHPRAKWSRPAFSQVKRQHTVGRTVRTLRWRYTEWDEGRAGAELYDHASDPREWRNLAGQPAHATTVRELSAILRGGAAGATVR